MIENTMAKRKRQTMAVKILHRKLKIVEKLKKKKKLIEDCTTHSKVLQRSVWWWDILWTSVATIV